LIKFITFVKTELKVQTSTLKLDNLNFAPIFYGKTKIHQESIVFKNSALDGYNAKSNPGQTGI